MLKKQFLVAAILAAATLSASAAGFSKTAAYTPGQFADIPEAEWYAGEVAGAYELGLMNGTGATTFEPDGNVTVAEAITMASRAASIYAGETIPEAEGEWYQKYVNYAVSKGLITDGAFDSYDRAAKRYEVAVIFKNALPADYYTAKNTVESIPDVSAASDYADALLTLYKAGVVMGSDSYGNFFPENNITRAEAAAIINRVALPENRLSKTLDVTTEDDAYTLILTSAFTHGNEGLASGWQLDNRGGLPRTSLKEPYGSLFDVSETAPTALIRPFNKTVTGTIDLYTKVSTNAEDGVYMAFRSEAGKDVYRLETKDGAWMLLKADGSSEKLYEIAEDESNFTFEVKVDIDNARSTTYINGKSCGTHALALTEGIDLAEFRWGTTEASTASVSVSKVNATANYAINESFEFVDVGTLPYGWTGTDGIYSNGSALKADGVQSASVSFSPVGGKIIAEFDHRLPKGESIRYALRSGAKDVAVFTSDDKNFYVNGTAVYENYYQNQWYRMRFELDTDTQNILVKLNGRKIADVPFAEATTSIDNLAVANNSETEAVLDSFKVFREIEHDDYVPEPVIPAGTDKYTVGMNVCSLWRNGTGSTGGWNCIAAYKDVEPVLGYYDEGNPETADWEIKYTLEHGIDFQAFCVFFESGWGTEPQRPDSSHLSDGFMNAKYSDMAKFAIIWEAANAQSPCEWRTWTESYVPYFIENYFKDPRYVTVDNRPVLCVFGSGNLSSRIGGDSKVKEMFDYLEEEVKKLGFDGMIYLSCGSASDSLAAMGFDGAYAYNWGTAGYQLETNKSSILASANVKSMYTVPTISVGFNNMPWGKTRHPMMSASDYVSAHAWVTDEYIPNYATEDWQKQLVMLSTWNEYGEGTYIMPTTDEKSFMYLNATREAYTDEKASDAVNVIPTASQRYRINHLYPQDLHLLRRQGYYVEEVKDVEYETVCTFDFTKEDDRYALWGVNASSVGEDGVSGSSTNDSIIIYQKLGDENISLNNVSAIRLTAKIPKGSTPELYYITEEDQSWNQAKHANFKVSETDDFAVYTVSMESHKAFTGKLMGIRIDPVSLPGLNFTVTKLELLSPVGGKMSKDIMINGQKCEMYFSTQQADNGDMLLAFDPEVGIDFRLNTYHTWDQDTKTLTLYFTDHTVVYTVGSDTYTLDGASKKLPYKLTDIDGLPLIPIKTLCEEVGYTYSIDADNVISIDTPEKSYFEANEEDRVYGQWEFNTIADTEGWKSSFMTLFVNDGYMSCETTGASTDPTIVYSDKIRMNAEDYERIEYRVRYKYNSESKQQLTMYFGTNQSSGLSEDKTIKITLNSNDSKGEWEVYTMNLSEVTKWKDLITSLRFDPFNATGQIDIDYIRFIPKEGVTPGEASATDVTTKEETKEETVAVVYDEPDIPLEDEEMGTLIWYNNFDETDKTAATYAEGTIKFSANGVSGNADVVDDPAKDGKAVKITPSGAHGGYAVSFKSKLSEPGEYTFVADIFVPDGAKIDQWIRFETIEADGSKNDPNVWEPEKVIKGNGKWYTWSVTRHVSEGTSIIDYSIRKVSAEEYYIDNVRVYRK